MSAKVTQKKEANIPIDTKPAPLKASEIKQIHREITATSKLRHHVPVSKKVAK